MGLFQDMLDNPEGAETPPEAGAAQATPVA